MKAYNRKPAIDNSSNLEDSAFEVITNDVAFLPSDDEDARTESLASTDGYTGDEISSIADTEEAEEDRERLGEELHSYGNDNADLEPDLSPFSTVSGILKAPSTSSLSISRTSSLDGAQKRSIILQKDVPASRAEIDFWREIKEVEAFDHSNMPAVFRDYIMPYIRIQRHITGSEQLLRPSEHFRVWYFGEPDHKADILYKLGSALYMGKSFGDGIQSNSDGAVRYNVTPVSSFTRDVALLPSSGIDLDVIECVVQSVDSSPHDNRSTITILLNDKVEVDIRLDGTIRVPSEFLDNFWLPDIAVFFHVPAHRCVEAGYTHMAMSAARNAVAALEIPVLDIYPAYTLPKATEKFNFGSRNLFMSLEGGTGSGEQTQTLAVFPIPLDQFLDLDPILLNRHLECLTRNTNSTTTEISSFASYFHRFLSFMASGIGKAVKGRLLVFAIIAPFLPLFLSMILANFVSLRQSVAPWGNSGDLRVDLISAAGLSLSTSSADVVQTSFGNPTSATVSTHSSTAGTVTAERGLGQPLIRSLFSKSNISSLQFEIHAAEHHCIALIPPKLFNTLKKAPRVLVVVSRGGNTIIHTEIEEPQESMYLIELPRIEAFGIVTVVVRTTSKPILNQTADINLGASWLSSYLFGQVSHFSDSLKAQRRVIHMLNFEPERLWNAISNISQPLIDNVCTNVARAGEIGKAVVLLVHEHRRDASAEAKKVAYSTVITISGAAGNIALKWQKATESGIQTPFPNFWRFYNSPLKLKSFVEARKKARGLSEMIKQRIHQATRKTLGSAMMIGEDTEHPARTAHKSNRRTNSPHGTSH